MSATYTYANRQIERDFKFIQFDYICRFRDVPSRVGQWGCDHCPYNKGKIYSWEHLPGTRWGAPSRDESYVMCSNPKAKDFIENSEITWAFNESFEYQALCALDG